MGDRAGSIPVIRSIEVVILEKSRVAAFFVCKESSWKREKSGRKWETTSTTTSTGRKKLYKWEI